MVDYKFKGFVGNNSSTWLIDVDVKDQDGNLLNYRVKNQKILQERIYILLINISNMDGVLRKINE